MTIDVLGIELARMSLYARHVGDVQYSVTTRWILG